MSLNQKNAKIQGITTTLHQKTVKILGITANRVDARVQP
jgi:hypothetical protein